MVCEQILGKLSEFDTSGKTIEYVDIEWHEAFKKIHKKTTDHGTELGIRMDDSILTRGLYQGDVLYADDEKIIAVNTPPCEVIRVSLTPGHEKQAAKVGVTQDILLEVNIGNEESKSGFTPDGARQIAAEMADYPHVRLHGLMAIPPVSEKPGDNCRYFAEMRNLFVDISAKKYDNVSMDCLSMGMSGDYPDAIREGATLVRVGTAIFGARNYNKV